MNVPEHSVRPVVMELFSSQGCGKCPDANANIAKLSERSDIIALTYTVGYWDYLGWDDTFAKPEFTERLMPARAASAFMRLNAFAASVRRNLPLPTLDTVIGYGRPLM